MNITITNDQQEKLSEIAHHFDISVLEALNLVITQYHQRKFFGVHRSSGIGRESSYRYMNELARGE